MRVKLLIGANQGEVEDLPYHAATALVASGQAALEQVEDEPGLATHGGVQLLSTDALVGNEPDEGEDAVEKAAPKPRGRAKAK